MSPWTTILVLIGIFVVSSTGQAVNPLLVGTWTTKSRKVITGPGFYNPEAETFTEPELTGIAYSFTGDGYYEEALFRAIPNPVDPSCPGAIIQWQHGSFIQNSDTSLRLTPISVDGRQLLSEPCKLDTSLLTRLNKNETFAKTEIVTDNYNGRRRLNLYARDGRPVNPMWLEYSAPEMLPTTTLNPTASAKARNPTATVSKTYMSKRNAPEKLLRPFTNRRLMTIDRWFCVAVGFIGVGGILLFCV